MDIRKLCTWTGIAILLATFLSGSAALAQGAGGEGMAEATWQLIGDNGLKGLGIGLGLGFLLIGGGKGIGNIGSSVAESMARQPEAANDIRGAGVLLAAFIEGATLFGVVVLLILVFV